MGKKSSAPAPTPDPAIGQAAVQNTQLGQNWLDFSKQQFAAGEARQDNTDAMIGKVADSALASQDQANKWAQEDRGIAADYRQKFDNWSNEDRALGRQTMSDMNSIGDKAVADGNQYGDYFDAQTGKFGKQADAFNAIGSEQNAFGADERNRYTTLFRPVQDRMVNDAMTWDSNERLDSEAAKAKADVVSGAAQQREASQRAMASMGVNPNSGRFAGVTRAGDISTALGAAGAQNASRDTVRSQGIQLRQNAAQLGQQVLANSQQATQMGLQADGMGLQANGMGLQAAGAAHSARMAGTGTALQARTAGLAAAGIGNTTASMGAGQQGAGYAGLGLGLQAGGSAVGANQAGNSNFYQNNGTMQGGFSGAMQGYTNSGNMLNSLYGNQLNGWGMQQQANSAAAGGIGSMLGTIGGAAITAY